MKIHPLIACIVSMVLIVVGIRTYLGYMYHGWHWLSTLITLICFLGSSTILMISRSQRKKTS
jgi:type IV secretory pathway VirB2 component (pilin)